MAASNGKRQGIVSAFFAWYERHYVVNLAITAGLFALQVVHLYWLATDVIAGRLFGVSFFDPGPTWQYLIIVVDYTEVPALISTTVLYLYELRHKFSWKSVLFLLFLNSQWLHLFWITDEFVVNQFAGRPDTILPVWLAWVAILIDYLEVPVIIDTFVKLFGALRKGPSVKELREVFKED